MKNVINKLGTPSSLCYFYIILLSTSIFIDPAFKSTTILMTITTTLVSISILWELKKQINLKLNIHQLDFFFIFFIFIKIVLSTGHLLFPGFTQDIISHTSFNITIGTLQLIYSSFLIKISDRKVKHLWLYGWLILTSSIFLILKANMGVIYVMSIANTYILSEAFYELRDLSTRKLHN